MMTDVALLESDKEAFGVSMLKEIVEWIGDNLLPDQVFSDGILRQWACEESDLKPENIFSDQELATWAVNHGFVWSE